ncbi:Pentatricopeptide repeat-containing protein [Seminavis robusta]|uniref:Pentatricopeptide repeat-containing protein n=1 Tax=Seminavis robusta TaxID=568900 RepID=A0A9N8EB81_9STRA|nr:Pentatricopeptide repeat-containing protein [Seminavis robusta]|eukprot:Sro915_g219690.1 Pentatricopeptide repeat-containing protein (620) ;mRNA; r:11007-13036
MVDAFSTVRNLACFHPSSSSLHHYDRIGTMRMTDAATSEEDDSDKERPPFSKLKWKKKRYLMMKDVRKLIDAGDNRAPRKAHEIVTRMHKLSEIYQDEDLRPDEQVYNLWINAISKCCQKADAGKQAEDVLHEMRKHHVQPSIVSYTTVMNAYAQSSGRRNRAAQEAERVLYDVLDQQPQLKVSAITCDTVLKAWAKRGDMEGAERAQLILERLEQTQLSDIQPTSHSYGTVIHAWATCRGGTEAAEKAQEILDKLLQPNHAVKPDTVVFNSVIHAWANSKDSRAGPKAVELLHKMKDLHNPQKGFHTAPDTFTYNTVLSSWSHSDDMGAATETERVLKEMQEAYKESPETAPAPNTVSYNSVLHAWSRSTTAGAVKRAQAVLDFMIRSKQEAIAPDVFSFTSVLNSLAKSKEPGKAMKCRQLLFQMLQLYDNTQRPSLKPTQVPFNAVLNACAFSASDTTDKEKKDAVQIAISTFYELSQRAKPDTVSYGNLMKCFHNLLPPGQRRNEMALQLFDNCSKAGLVGDLVWNEVRRTVQSRVLVKALKLENSSLSSLQVRDLPRSWTNRVQGDKLAARRRDQERRKRRQQQQPTRRRASNNRRSGPNLQISEPSYQSGKDL